MANLHERLDDTFDPTDADKSSAIAHCALRLMRYAVMAAESQELGMRIGRDVAMELSAHSLRLAESMGLLSWHNLAPERNQFFTDLLGREPQLTPLAAQQESEG